MTTRDKDLDLINHVLSYCIEIEQTIQHFGNDYDVFAGNKIYRNAATMCILQIGELTSHLSNEFTEINTEIPWRSIKGMRNIVAHAYGSVSIEIIWETLTNRIPDLKNYCEKLFVANPQSK